MLKTSRVPLASLLLALAGLAVSIYLTVAHYSTTDLLVCAENSLVDCASVTSSDQSRLFGIPVADLGTAFYAFLTLLCLPQAWRSRNPWIGWARLGSVGVGVLMVVYLIAAEVFLIGKICLWCTVVHVITLALAALLVTAELRTSNV
ncbi:vitamin K epoxide reductase family protein [Umezawaea endophytica]|uniref:Vitamin K epoxide reductase family protein n=1 Tax=Umezawaea endophytica TaxID=1654476 RepID=A0A9X2VP97_9PSEU|nr:vitamin K epoxide reductase family protein [Umezawaea endophytica]MCS7480170.1 vitamin K epoxide reductase family protein [Umezawaea endophytica]